MLKDYTKIRKCTPVILTCVSLSGLVATAILTAKSAIKASKQIAEMKKSDENVDKKEILKKVVPIYVPPIIVGASTAFCISGIYLLNRKQQASLYSAYMLAENAYRTYKNKVIELYGEEMHQNIIESIAKEKAEKRYISAPSVCQNARFDFIDESEERLFYDLYSDRYFEATFEQVLLAEYHLNRNYILRGDTSVNEFYEFLGINEINNGFSLGWDYSSGIGWIDFNHSKTILDDGLECYIIEMVFPPSVPDDL